MNKPLKKRKNKLTGFYSGFRKGVQEIKFSLDGKTELKDAKTWLCEL